MTVTILWGFWHAVDWWQTLPPVCFKISYYYSKILEFSAYKLQKQKLQFLCHQSSLTLCTFCIFIVWNGEKVTIFAMFIGICGQFFPNTPHLQCLERQRWTWRRLWVWIHGWPYFPTTKRFSITHPGRNPDHGSLAACSPELYEKTIKVQRKDEKKLPKVMSFVACLYQFV